MASAPTHGISSVSIGTKILEALSGGIGGKILDTIDKFVPDKDLRDTLKKMGVIAEVALPELEEGAVAQEPTEEPARDIRLAVSTPR